MGFPCRFPIKAMGRNRESFQELVTGIILAHAELHGPESVNQQSSSSGNFLSITVVIKALSKDQLDRIYQDLTDHSEILMAL